MLLLVLLTVLFSVALISGYADYIAGASISLIVWLLLSAFGSFIRMDARACSGSYYVDYVIATNAFCKIEEEKK